MEGDKEEILARVREECQRITEQRRAFAEKIKQRQAKEKAEWTRRLHEEPRPIDQLRHTAAHLAAKATEHAVLRLRYIAARQRHAHPRSCATVPGTNGHAENGGESDAVPNDELTSPLNPQERLWQTLARQDCTLADIEQVFEQFREHVRMHDAKVVWDILAALPASDTHRPVLPRQGSTQLRLPDESRTDRGYCLFLHPNSNVSNVTLHVGGQVNLQVPLRGNGSSAGRLPYQPLAAGRTALSELKWCLPGWGDAAPVWCSNRATVTLLNENDEEIQLTVLALRCPSLIEGLACLSQAQLTAAHRLVVHAENQVGMPALTFASLHGNLPAVRYLLAHGASVNYKTKNCRSSALHEAVRSCNLQLLQLLVQAGAKLHGTDRNGDTPLHIACRMNNFAAAKMLISVEKGSRALNVKNHRGHLPVDCVRATGSTALAELMRAKTTAKRKQLERSRRKSS